MAPMANVDDKHQEFALGYARDDAAVAHPGPPKTALTDQRHRLCSRIL